MLVTLSLYFSSIIFWIVILYIAYFFRERLSKIFQKVKVEKSKGKSIANVLAVVAALASYWISGVLLLSAAVYFVVYKFSPPFINRFLLSRKLQEFDHSFYETLRSIASSLKAGLTLKDAIHVSAISSSPVVAKELNHVLKLYQLGYSIEDALEAMRKRIPTESCNIAIGSMVISSRVGGKLPQALTRIASTIKEREKIEGKLKALTAQGRSQAALLVCAPPLLGLGMYFFDRPKFEILTTTTIGQVLLGVAVFLEVAGILVTHRVMKLEI